jgi:hypothetical protein
MCCYERVSTTDDVTAAVLLAILDLAVSSETFGNGMYAQMPGCFNVGDCFLFTHLHLVLRLKMTGAVYLLLICLHGMHRNNFLLP